MKKILMLVFMFFIFVSTSLAFSDYSNFIWAKDAIDNWNSRGYISGYPDGTFRGNNNITRAEVISIINKLNNSNVTATKRPSKDVNIGDWFYEDMAKAYISGLISLDENGNLRPNDLATREEVMVILSKLLNITYSGNLDNAKVKQFSDCNDISSNNYKRVAGIVEEGFVNGYKDNTLKPKANITRAEFMCVLNNAISEVISRGNYDNRALVGNVIINEENVRLTNSEILGKVFVLDGAKNDLPDLINTKVSKGINSRVGEILIKNVDDYETLTEYNYENPEEYNKPVFAKVNYSKIGWTNDDVEIKVSFNNDEAEAIDGKRITVNKNGEYIIEYVYNGNVRSIVAKVDNIDKEVPKITTSVTNIDKSAIITVEVANDGLSPIVEIYCSNGAKNSLNKETNEIENSITVDTNGEYIICAKDEAGNIGQVKVDTRATLPKYTVSYNLTGGTGDIVNQIKYERTDLKLTDKVPVREGYRFFGWSTSPDMKKIEYEAGDMFYKDENTTLYAMWREKMPWNFPLLGEGMVPVKWDKDEKKWVETTEFEWEYNYESATANHGTVEGNGTAMWANAMIDADGDGVLESEYVWIPRFTYKVTEGDLISHNADNVPTGKIGTAVTEIKFSNEKADDLDGEYKKHGAFSPGGVEITGFWIGKYEASTNQNLAPLSMPKTLIHTMASLEEIYNWAKDLNGTNKVIGAHMIKDSEWGAVAYLTSAVGRIPYINTHAGYYTGWTFESQDTTLNSQYMPSAILYNQPKGVKGSTTHNIYGVFDMSGGRRENVAAYHIENNSEEIDVLKLAENKYVDRYNTLEPTGDNARLGWDGDHVEKISTTELIARGGSRYEPAKCGIFGFEGRDFTRFSTRVTLFGYEL